MQLDKVTILKKYPQNVLGCDYFVGDIHGHYDLLMSQLVEIGFNFEVDRLFAVGDLIDRGAESEKCIELLIEPWFHSVLGNHEHLYLRGFDYPEFWDVLIKNGGKWIQKWLDTPKKLLNWAHLIRIKMPLSMSIVTPYGIVGITHAHAPEDWATFSRKAILDLTPFIWRRQNFDKSLKWPIVGIDAVLHGHNPVDIVQVMNNQLWTDTLQKTGRLTLLSAKDVFRLIREI